jgi:hypothetical protein
VWLDDENSHHCWSGIRLPASTGPTSGGSAFGGIRVR